ncbi:hypothetical protein KAH37_07335 [bacterium]|nr:hypothetical protein [bacterium]
MNFIKSVVVGALLLFSYTISASSFYELTGAPDEVNPLNARFLSSGPAATYFNPSLLMNQQDTATLAVVVLIENLDISYLPRDDAQYNHGNSSILTDDVLRVPSSLAEAGIVAPLPTDSLINQRPSATTRQDVVPVVSFGLVKTIIKKWLTIGVYAQIPMKGLQVQDPFFVDEREQYFSNQLHFEKYEDRLQQFSMAIALGGRISKFLSIGAGVAFTSYTVTNNEVYVPDASNPSYQLINSHMKIGGQVAPIVGVNITPWRGFSLTGTFHYQRNTGIVELNNRIQLSNPTMTEDPDINPSGKPYLDASSTITAGYQPINISVGLSYRFEAKGYGLTPLASFSWERWSTYINRHGEKPSERYSWNDTFSFSAGFKMDHKDRKAGVDFVYVPTPVPSQTGQENYIDNDRVGFALGYTEYFHFKTFSIGGGLNVQFQWLLNRSVEKNIKYNRDGTTYEGVDGDVVDEFPDHITNSTHPDGFDSAVGLQTNNPGYPGFSSNGMLFGSSIYISFLY